MRKDRLVGLLERDFLASPLLIIILSMAVVQEAPNSFNSSAKTSNRWAVSEASTATNLTT